MLLTALRAEIIRSGASDGVDASFPLSGSDTIVLSYRRSRIDQAQRYLIVSTWKPSPEEASRCTLATHLDLQSRDKFDHEIFKQGRRPNKFAYLPARGGSLTREPLVSRIENLGDVIANGILIAHQWAEELMSGKSPIVTGQARLNALETARTTTELPIDRFSKMEDSAVVLQESAAEQRRAVVLWPGNHRNKNIEWWPELAAIPLRATGGDTWELRALFAGNPGAQIPVHS